MTRTIRPARSADYDAYLQLVPELRTGDPPPTRESWDAQLVARTFVVEQHGNVAAYATVQPLSDTFYVRNVVVAARARRRGVGLALMDHLRALAVASGARTWRLNVKPDNAAAIGLYSRVGMQPVFRSVWLELPWTALSLLPMASAAVSASTPAPSEDASLERRFALPAGTLADCRSVATHRLVSLCEDDQVVAVARFAPKTSVAYPFRLTRPELVRAMLEAIRPHTSESIPWICFAAEDDEPLVTLVRAAGATVRMETVHMQGAI